jgi:hypothetical protein
MLLSRLTKKFVFIEARICYYDIYIFINCFNKNRFLKFDHKLAKMPAQRPVHDKPFGAENYDNGALDDKQQEKLNQRKVMIIDFNNFITIFMHF